MEAILRARLRRWFTPASEGVSGGEDVNLSLAALLVEIMRADYKDDPREFEMAKSMLARHFGLDGSAAEQLLQEGERAADQAVSLFKHTRSLDVGLPEQEKFDVIELLWKIAFADGAIHGQEDYLVHKVGDLLHVRHSDIMRIKEQVRSAMAGHTDAK